LANPAYPAGCSEGSAPVTCVTGRTQNEGIHKACHAIFDPIEQSSAVNGKMPYSTAKDAAAKSMAATNNDKELTDEETKCVKFQLDSYYKKCLNKNGAVDESAPLNATSSAAGKVVSGGL
jgi:hypothetical protein